MTTRQPLQTLSPPSANIANIANTRHTHVNAKGANGYAAMEAQDDTQDLASVASGLSSLENDAEDDFEKRMIQHARDERRLNEALHGRAQAFRKARTHPRVGLTMDSLERMGANAHVTLDSPPSSSGSTRSDPAIHAPPGWGRKGRTNRNWMRAIKYEEERPRTPGAADDAINGHVDPSHQQQYAEDDDDGYHGSVPRRSVEDSPLSHKGSIHGTPHNDRSADWDLTFELNEASMIASTPYIPRNTALDDIRQREIASLRDQGVTTARLDRIREGSPEQIRRPRSSSAKSTNTVSGTTNKEPVMQGAVLPEKNLRTRMNLWQPFGKSQPVTGIGKENSPIAMYKSAENLGTVEHSVLANAQHSPPKPLSHRKEDSQDLLRRLARVSNTPSPGRVAASRPQTAPARQINSLPQAMASNTAPLEQKNPPAEAVPELVDIVDPRAAPEVQTQQEELPYTNRNSENVPEALPESSSQDDDIDVTPIPHQRSILNLKTPVVTGAWVDTPGPRTAQRPISTSRSPSRSLNKSSPQKVNSPDKLVVPSTEKAIEGVATQIFRPSLPSSALQALVQEAKTNGRRQSADFGDSTIDSLEDLITPIPGGADGEVDEDTLQGLQLPTGTPRNEAERQRQQELFHLHRMNDRLRAARTSIRDASRGMKRVEDRVEHAEDGETSGEKVKVAYRECPCATYDRHQFSLWRWWISFFWQKRIKTARKTSDSRWKIWGGLTGLGIFMLVFFTYWISEEVACEIYCHHLYAHSSPYPYGVNMNAPRYPFVIPTLIYRNFIKAWWLPLYSFICWICTTTYKLTFGFNDTAEVAGHVLREGVGSTATKEVWRASSQAAQFAEESDWDLSMADDQLLR